MTTAPLGRGTSGRNPTDRGTQGTKRPVLTEASGVPVRLAVAGANRHDVRRLLAPPLARIPVPRLRPNARQLPRLWLEKGDDITLADRLRTNTGFTSHVRAWRDEVGRHRAGTRAHRWVVERTHSWSNRFRALLVRWAVKAANHLALFHRACALIALQHS